MSGPVAPEQAVLDASTALAVAAQQKGLALSQGATMLLLAQAWFESFYGRHVAGYDETTVGGATYGRMQGSNNWGSIDSTAGWEAKHQALGYGKFAHTDSLDGTPQTNFVAWFRVNPNQLTAAIGFLDQVLYGNPAALTAALAGGPAAYAHWLKSHGYYGVTEAQYAAALSGASGTVTKYLTRALAQGLVAVDPSLAGQNENDFVPVQYRVAANLLSRVNPPSGVVLFVGPCPGGGSGLLGPALAALAVLILAVGMGVLAVPAPLRRLLA
jgi:hypothetical protein